MDTSKTKNRNWNITINGYNDMDTLLTFLNNYENCKYFLIIHDEDLETIEHIHLVVSYQNPISFNSVKNRYSFANKPHLEPCISLNKSIQYLIHINDKSKHQYPIDNIITNVEDLTPYFINAEQNDFIDNDNTLRDDISNHKYKNLMDLITSKDYSLKYIQQRYKVIEMLFHAYHQPTPIQEEDTLPF